MLRKRRVFQTKWVFQSWECANINSNFPSWRKQLSLEHSIERHKFLSSDTMRKFYVRFETRCYQPLQLTSIRRKPKHTYKNIFAVSQRVLELITLEQNFYICKYNNIIKCSFWRQKHWLWLDLRYRSISSYRWFSPSVPSTFFYFLNHLSIWFLIKNLGFRSDFGWSKGNGSSFIGCVIPVRFPAANGNLVWSYHIHPS